MPGDDHQSSSLKRSELEAQIYYRLIERLSASERRHRALVEGLRVVVFQCNPDGRLAYLNPAWAVVIGQPVSLCLGKPLGDFLVPEDRPILSGLLAQPEPRTRPPFEIRFIGPAGRELTAEISLQWVPDEGWIGSLLDVTARREAEQALARAKLAAEEADRLKTDFLANISHEIRTPISALIGFSSNLVDQELSSEERLDHVARIQENGQRLLQVINDLLDYSELAAGRLQCVVAPCDPRALTTAVAERFGDQARNKGLSVAVEVAAGVPALVETDANRVQLVLGQLVGNAVKFTARGGVRIDVRPAEDGSRLQFAVRDTGVGIPADGLAGLFSPFHQVDTSHTRSYGGSGLGLAIAQGVARLLDGSVTVESEPGRGSCFTLDIPLRESAGNLAPGGSDNGSDLAGRVLVAEDTPDMAALVERLLVRMGLTVTMAGNGAEARDQAIAAMRRGEPFDLVLMDMQMPVLDGYRAVAELRGAGYIGTVIAVTAHGLAADRDRCLAAGCDDFIAKPFRRGELRDLLARRLPPSRATSLPTA